MKKQPLMSDIRFKQASILFCLGINEKVNSELQVAFTQVDDGFVRWIKASLEGPYVVLHDISENAAKSILRYLHHKGALPMHTSGGGVREEEIWKEAGMPIGSDPAYSYGDSLPTGKSEYVSFLEKKPAATDTVQFSGRILKINVEKLTGGYRLWDHLTGNWPGSMSRRDEAIAAVLRVFAGAKTFRSLKCAFASVSRAEHKELNPFNQKDMADYAEKLCRASREIKSGFAKAGIDRFMSPGQLNGLVAFKTGKKLKIM